jgi:Domain of unknown function (DUF4410)
MKHNKCSSLWLCALVIFAGCASGNIRSRQEYTGEKIARPDHIVVHDFTASASDNLGYTPDQMETGRKLGAEVARDLVAEIRQMGLPAERAGAITPQAGDLVIKGHFVTIEQAPANVSWLD